MSKGKVLSTVKKALCYLVGLFVITLGIIISKKSKCGISPVSSIPGVCEKLWPQFGLTEKLGFTLSLGWASIIVYCILVIFQLIVLGKQFRPFNILGIALAWLFGFMVDFSGWVLQWLPDPSNYFVQLVYLAVSMVIIAIGVFLYLRPHWLPMPAEGLAAALAQRTGLAFGNCKTIVDSSMIAVALILQLIFLGGIASFTNGNGVVREGTIASAVLIGQIVKLLTKWMGKKVDKWIA